MDFSGSYRRIVVLALGLGIALQGVADSAKPQFLSEPSARFEVSGQRGLEVVSLRCVEDRFGKESYFCELDRKVNGTVVATRSLYRKQVEQIWGEHMMRKSLAVGSFEPMKASSGSLDWQFTFQGKTASGKLGTTSNEEDDMGSKESRQGRAALALLHSLISWLR